MKEFNHYQLINGGYSVYKEEKCPHCEGHLYYKNLNKKNAYNEVDMYCRVCKCMISVSVTDE